MEIKLINNDDILDVLSSDFPLQLREIDGLNNTSWNMVTTQTARQYGDTLQNRRANAKDVTFYFERKPNTTLESGYNALKQFLVKNDALTNTNGYSYKIKWNGKYLDANVQSLTLPRFNEKPILELSFHCDALFYGEATTLTGTKYISSYQIALPSDRDVAAKYRLELTVHDITREGLTVEWSGGNIIKNIKPKRDIEVTNTLKIIVDQSTRDFQMFMDSGYSSRNVSANEIKINFDNPIKNSDTDIVVSIGEGNTNETNYVLKYTPEYI